MKNFQTKVKEFQIASGQPVSDVHYKLTNDEFNFREELLKEELKELKEAIVDDNRIEILDALCDLKYVNDGTANQMGVEQDDLLYEETFDVTYDSLNGYLDRLSDISIDNVDTINAYIYALVKKLYFSLENFLTALDRVHLSNMSKFCIDTKTAEKTKQFYLNQGIETIAEVRNKVTVVYRKEDKKVLKSVEYHPVILNDLI